MSDPVFILPAGYARVKGVGSFEELVSTPFGEGVNALCWPRRLRGDFGEVVAALGVGKGITTIDEGRLKTLALSEAGKMARAVLLEDLERLRAHELLPVLDCIDGYVSDIDADDEEDENREEELVPTHVQSFHVDSATVAADTYLCTYHGPASEGLRNEEARRRVDFAETRAALLKAYGGPDDAGFAEYLNDRYYDLHYTPLPGAQPPFDFGLGNLWRIACEYPGCPVPPCIHRAPPTLAGTGPRLLLIS